MKEFENLGMFDECFYLEEGFSLKRPAPESGYKIEKSKGPSPDNPKRLVMGYRKTKVKKSASRHISRASAVKRSRKAKMTKKRNPNKMKKAMKRAVKTRKANKK